MSDPPPRQRRQPRVTRPPYDPEAPGQPLRAAIDAYLKNQGLEEVSLFARVLEIWSDVVGNEVAAHVRPSGFSGEDLVVEVDQPGWATEVAFLSETITGRIAERLGAPIGKYVKVHVRGRFSVE